MMCLTHFLAHNKYSNNGSSTRERAENKEKAITQNNNVRESPQTEGSESPDLKIHPSAQHKER